MQRQLWVKVVVANGVKSFEARTSCREDRSGDYNKRKLGGLSDLVNSEGWQVEAKSFVNDARAGIDDAVLASASSTEEVGAGGGAAKGNPPEQGTIWG